MTTAMHSPGEDNGLRDAIFQYATHRLDYNPPPLDGPQTFENFIFFFIKECPVFHIVACPLACVI